MTNETERADNAEHNFTVEHKRALDAESEVQRLMDSMDAAWGVIANAGWHEDPKSPGWDEAAAKWRDEHWHPALKRNITGI